ncbi:MAG: hypothetical protein ABIH46_02460 [Chloroflexota bacterium]
MDERVRELKRRLEEMGLTVVVQEEKGEGDLGTVSERLSINEIITVRRVAPEEADNGPQG